MAAKHWEQNKDATVYVGNIDERFTQELLSELMTQVGPVRGVHMPQDRVSQTHQGYGFVEFDTPQSADYAAKVLNGIRIWGKPVRVNKASADKQRSVDIGAELFVNGLDPQVDERILFDTFSRFGTLLRAPHILRDDNHISKGYGFVSFDSFEASDAARDTMNGQYIMGRVITVEYAYKKDGKGERHGDEAERKLAAEGKRHNIVPERQALPAAYHMTAPAATPAVAEAAPPSAPASFADATPSMSSMPMGASPVTPVSAGLGMPLPHHIPSQPFAMPSNPPGPGRPTIPPPAGFNAVPPPNIPGRPNVLPPAPSGLPARPPPTNSGFSVPGGAQAGFRGPPGALPGGPPPPGAMFPAGMPPPGFAPNGLPQPPPGFPPPGFGAPPIPPNGYGVRR